MNFREITMNSLFFSRIYFEFSVLSANSRTHLIFRIPYDFSLCFAYILWIHFEFSMNSLGVSLISYAFTIFFLEFTMNLLYFSRINYEFTLFFANSSCFHSLSIADSVRIPLVLREFTMNWFLVSQIRWLFRENIMN